MDLKQATEEVDQVGGGFVSHFSVDRGVQARRRFLEADSQHHLAMNELKREEEQESLKKVRGRRPFSPIPMTPLQQNDWKTILSKSRFPALFPVSSSSFSFLLLRTLFSLPLYAALSSTSSFFSPPSPRDLRSLCLTVRTARRRELGRR
eukprot:758133-Hanusia_phi.AAC.1